MRQALFVALGVAALVTLLAAAPPVGPAPAAVTVTASSAASPNGDGVKDTVAIAVDLSAAATLTVTVEDSGGVVAVLVSAGAADAGTMHLAWDGQREGGGLVPDGVYGVQATAVAPDGAESTASAQVRIDTRPPAVRWLTLHEQPGAGPLRATYRVTDAAATVALALVVRDRSGREWIAGRSSAAPGSHGEPWPLHGAGGGRLGPGAYRVKLRATDDAGNTSSSPVRAVLVEYAVPAHVIRRVDGAGNVVALTFDDCNDGLAWASILRTLEARHLQASFFCLGSCVERHASQARRALRDGDTVGNHTWTHAFLPARSYADVQSEVERTTQAWWRLARAAPFPYFRPPYGALSPTALSAIGSKGYSTVVLWDVDPQDWRRPGVAAIVERATGPVRAGSIVLMHVLPETAAALPAIITRLQGRGLQPVSLDRLLGMADRP